jgi:ankyrin repeat protein
MNRRNEWFDAVDEGNLNALTRMLNQFAPNNAAFINQNDGDGNTALTVAANQGDVTMVQRLIERGANLNAQDGDGRTALAIAIDEYTYRLLHDRPDTEKYLTIAKRLWSAGADPNLEDGNHYTVFRTLMYSYKNTESARNKQALDSVITYMLRAPRRRNERQIILDIDKLLFDAVYGSNYTVLMGAAAEGHAETVQYLLEELGTDPNVENEEGDNALSLAMEGEYLPIIIMLLRSGASINDRVRELLADPTTSRRIVSIVQRGEELQRRARNMNQNNNNVNVFNELNDMLENNNNNSNNENDLLLNTNENNNNQRVAPLPLMEENENNVANRANGPRNIGNNVQRLGQCFDFIEAENVNAKNFLRGSKNRILFVDTDKQVYCMRRNMSPKLFYACKQPNGHMMTTVTNQERAQGKRPESNVIDGRLSNGSLPPGVKLVDFQYARVGANNNLVRVKELDKLKNRSYDIFMMRRSKEAPLAATCSVEVRNRGGQWVSAYHCQEGSGGTIYTIDAYSLEEGRVHLPRYFNIEKRRRTRKHAAKKKKRATKHAKKH